MGRKGVEISMKGYCDKCKKVVDQTQWINFRDEVICEACFFSFRVDNSIDFRDYVNAYPIGVISRGHVIDKLSDKKGSWVYIIKALLIKNTTRYVSTLYLLEKIDFVNSNPIETAIGSSTSKGKK